MKHKFLSLWIILARWAGTMLVIYKHEGCTEELSKGFRKPPSIIGLAYPVSEKYKIGIL